MLRKITISIIILSSATLICPQLAGQGRGDGNELIEWVRQYPDEKAKEQRNFFQKVGDLVLGAKPELINKPVGIVPGEEGELWVLSQENGSVLKMSDAGTVSVCDKIMKDPQIYPSLVSMCSFPGGMLFTDSYLDQVIFIEEKEKRITTFNSNYELNQPTGIAYSKVSDQVWIVETAAHRISVFDREGNYVKSIGQRGTEPGSFNFPTHIWIDKRGMAYVVDAMNFRIQVFNEDGSYISNFGKSGDATGSMARPKGVATDSRGNIYVADALFNNVQIFNEKGEFLYYFGSRGNGQGQFWMPAGIYIDEKDFIYVSDSYNNRIQVFQLLKGV